MSAPITQKQKTKTSVAILSSPGSLSLSLTENLLAKSCKVVVVTNEKEWEQQTQHIRHNQNLEIITPKQLNSKNVKYFIYISPLLETKDSISTPSILKAQKETSILAREYIEQQKPRTIIVGPYSDNKKCVKEFKDAVKELLKANKENSGVILVSDILGFRLLVNDRKLINRVVKDFVQEKAIRAPKKEAELFPIPVNKVAESIVRNMFSFGPFFGEKLLLIGPKYSVTDFLKLVGEQRKEASFKYDDKVWDLVHLEPEKRIIIESNISTLIKETFSWFEKNRVAVKKTIHEKTASNTQNKQIKNNRYEKTLIADKKVEEPKSVIDPVINQKSRQDKVKKKSKGKRNVAVILALILIVMLSPAILLAFGLGTAFIGVKAVEKNNYKMAKTSLLISEKLARVSKDDWGFYLKALDTIGISDNTSKIYRIYNTGYQASLLNEKASMVGVKVITTVPSIAIWIGNAINGEGPISEEDIKNLTLELGAIHKELGFLQGEIEQIDTLGSKVITKYVNNVDTKRLREYVLAGQQIVVEMDEILGGKQKKTYLVLFENNMELRPTGGFVGAIALVSFSGGKLNDFSVMDTYSVDGQLKGFVQAPKPLEKYMDQPAWFIRDANWNSDFPSSAVKIEWFLDKAIGKEVDGVIAVDLEFVKNILEELGPIYLEDFDKEINHENIYEIAQFEIGNSTVKESRQEALFLAAIARELLEEVTSSNKDQFLGIAREILESLEEKHALIFLHNTSVQKSISELGWDGSVYQTSCSGNCYADWVGLVDANIGANKANYYMERNADFTSFIRNNFIKRKLTINITNNAEFNPEDYNEYKTYLRVLAPADSKFEKIEIVSAAGTRAVEPDIEILSGRKEAGVFVKIEPGDTKTVNFVWEGSVDLDFNKSGEYLLSWRKQPGTKNDKIATQFVFPEGVVAKIEQTDFLTQDTVLGYNTFLSEDINSKVFW